MGKNIRVSDYKGSWSLINITYHHGVKLGLYEHNSLGDEVFYLILDDAGNVVMEAWDGFDDLYN